MVSFLSLFESQPEGGPPQIDRKQLLKDFQDRFGEPFDPRNPQHRTQLLSLAKRHAALPEQGFVIRAQHPNGQTEVFEIPALNPKQAVEKLQYFKNNSMKVLNVSPKKSSPTYTTNP